MTTTQQEREIKIFLIEEIFKQGKFIGKQLKPFPIALREIIVGRYYKDCRRFMAGHTFDVLYMQENSYLQALEVSLRTHVNYKLSEQKAAIHAS